MRIYHPKNNKPLHPDLIGALVEFRSKRSFHAETYIRAKGILLNNYMQHFKLNVCVVALSGGIDSAVTLGLIAEAHKMKDSPIRRIVAVLLPILKSNGATNQKTALARGREVAEAFGVEHFTIDLSETQAIMKHAVDTALKIGGGAWAEGQLVSYLRTPVLYYVTSLLAQEDIFAILCGTTNRDEGAYLGFFGKASDGMVDLQLISDIHKSEVQKVAQVLGVPESVRKAKPSGDMFDGRTDEEVFGASYDFVELYISYLSNLAVKEQKELRLHWSADAKEQFDELRARLEALHTYNLHKYLGDSPSVHLDIHERAVPGGWRTSGVKKYGTSPDRSAFVGEFSMDAGLVEKMYRREHRPLTIEPLADFGESAILVKGLLDVEECFSLQEILGQQEEVPVGQNGMKKGFDKGKGIIGSYRASFYDERMAKILWDRVCHYLPRVRIMQDDTPTDWDGKRVWRPVGINPLFRYIRYKPDGLLIPHYDAPYEFHPGKKTLMSLVLYLSDANENSGGATRFLRDPQQKLPLSQRRYDDWTRPASSQDVMFCILPKAGCGLILDHRILHDSEVLREGSSKILIRTDIVFECLEFSL